MLIIRGVNVFPSQIEEVLLKMEGIHPHYLITVNRVNNLDNMMVQVEVEQEFFIDRISELQALSKKLQHNLESALGIGVEVKLVEPKTIARSEGKAKRVVDNRKLV
jgi:phenylacetate-CoA ligase